MTRRRWLTCFVVTLSFVATGCSIWDSATSYFNTYYNAQRLFQEAEEELWAQPDLRYSGRDLLAPIGAPQGARTKFTSVIEKGSKLLQYHPSSSLVDDALLMIGKSFYYQGEYQRAERKFKELIDSYGAEGTAVEARLWLACTYYRMNDLVESERLAGAIMENQDADGASKARAALLRARIEWTNKNAARSRELFAFGAEHADNADLEAQAWLAVASIDSAAGRPDGAETEYRRALSASRNYMAEYRARLGIARSRAAQGAEADALEDLRSLRSSQNYREFFGEIDLEIARVYLRAGETASAVQQYRIVDTTYIRSEWSATSSYELGRLFETGFHDLDSARAIYTRGRGAAPSAPISRELVKRADALTRYAGYRADLSRYDSLRQVPRAAAVSDSGAGGRGKDSLASTIPALPRDTVEVRRARAMGELANLFYATLELRDSASFYYRRLLAEYPEGPASARALFVLGQIASADSSEGRAVADSLYRVVLSRFPRSEFAGEVRRLLGLPAEKSSSDSAEVLYARAEEILLKARAADLSPAIAALQTVVERYPASPVAPRAMYAIGWTYEKGLDLPDSALSAYRRLLAAYPASQFALAVRPLVTEADAAAAGRAAPKDSTSVAAPPAIDQKQPPPARPEEQDPEVRRTRRTPVTPPPQPPPAVPGQERPKD